MESYLKKINESVKAKNTPQEAIKIKKRFLIAGGITLGLGLAGFVSSFITFMVLFLSYETDRAMIAWFVAIPFIIMIVAGSVITRVGDMLLRDDAIAKVEQDKIEAKNYIFEKKVDHKHKVKNGEKKALIGAIIGDIVGSKYEFKNLKSKDFPLFSEDCHFTDDSVMTLAVYKALKECNGDYNDLSNKAIECMQEVGQKYEFCGYGAKFYNWLFRKDPKPYDSYGNGSAMRITAVSEVADTIDEVKELSNKVTAVSHNNPEGLKGAEAVAISIFLAKRGKSKREIKKYIENNYYKLSFDYKDLVKNYSFDETCQNSVPQAIYCFLISESFEDCLRTSISIGGDSDTIACIACAIAGHYYGVPKEFEDKALEYLDSYLKDIYNM